MEIEIWKPVVEWEDAYEASNLGKIRSINRYVLSGGGRMALKQGRILKPSVSNVGYCLVYLSCKSKVTTRSIHRLVAKSFIPNPDNLPCINHKNGIKTDNRVENLEWCSFAYNTNHACETGLSPTGSKQYRSILTEENVKEIRDLIARGAARQVDLAKRFGVGHTIISQIISRKRWRFV